MDGEKTMDLVRNQRVGFCRKTPIIALTANAMYRVRKKSIVNGIFRLSCKTDQRNPFEAILLRYLPKEREYVIDPDESVRWTDSVS